MARSPRARVPRLLVLGAGPAQLGLLEAATKLGVWTAVADRDPAAPGFPLADRRCIVSTEDEPALERLASALALDGIIAPGTDWPVAIAARIAAKLGLPHPVAPATAVLATNKLRQRERLVAAGVPQPRWEIVTDGSVTIEPPCVVKAPDRQGQKGLSLVRHADELEAAVVMARGASRGGAALVEELVEGPEVTAIGFAGKTVAVTDRITADMPAFGVALSHVWPSQGPDRAAAVAEHAVAALGIERGPSYTQLRIGAAGPKVIEVAARLGGGHDAELVEAALGVPLNELAILAALGEDVTAPPPEPRVGGAVTRFLVAPPGVIESTDVPDELEGVVAVRVYRRPGTIATPLRRGSDRAGAVLVVGGSRNEAVARAERAAQAIRFGVGPGTGASRS